MARSPGRRGFLRLGASLAGTVALTGCNLHPLYAPQAFGGDNGGVVVQQRLREIAVGRLPDRDGQLLRLALQDRLEAGIEPVLTRYTLDVKYSISSVGLGLLDDNTTTYARIIGAANWTLLAQDANQTVLAHGIAQSTDGLNSFDNQPFAEDMEVAEVHKRIANAVADQITLRLAHYFTPSGKAQEAPHHSG